MRTDLINHALLGFTIATVFQFAGIYMIAIALLVGLLKELYDKFIKKTMFDWEDLVCTGIGGFAAWVIWVVYKIF